MDGSVNDELQGINNDIRQIAQENPHLAKWFTSTPELAEKKRKEKERKDKRKASKLASKMQTDPKTRGASNSNDISSDDDASDLKHQLAEKENEGPTKKAKTLPNITAYIEVNNPPHTLKEKPVPSPRGPFFFNLNTTHVEFLQSLASCCVEGHYAATVAAINQQQLSWKLQLTELTKKGKDTTITLSLPPLARVAANPTDISAGTRGVDLEREEFKEGPIGSTIREQQLAVCEGTAALLNKLRIKYPIGTDPRFPTKRVYSSEPDVLWELTTLRMQVWARHLGTATLDAPPNSVHFSESQRLRIPTRATATSETVALPVPPPAAVPQPPPNHMYQPFGGYPQYFPPPYPYPHPGNDINPAAYPTAPAHHLALPYPNAPPAMPPYPNAPPPPLNQNINGYYHAFRPRTPGIPRDAAPGSAPTSPLRITLPRPVSLDEFCDRYGIDDEDRARLGKLKMQPGDRRVEKLSREDWQGHAGFAKLAWEDFLVKHKTFVSDVKAGQWDMINGET